MTYENPRIPEGINVSQTNPLADMATMLMAVTGILALGLTVLFFASGYLVKFLPFSAEEPIGKAFADEIFLAEHCHPDANRVEKRLQNLANRLSLAQNTPQGMPLKVQLLESDEINAVATFGGRIYIMQGLLEKLPHENALAMVLSHEIAHIAHRDPLVALGRGAIMWVALSFIPGLGDFGTAQVLSQITNLAALGFSRNQEEAADKAALETLRNYYGYTTGAEALFETLKEGQSERGPALFSTHPVTEGRINEILQHQNASARGPLVSIEPYRLGRSGSKSPSCEIMSYPST
ncbi:MAG: putative Zn-dependent protease [Candidatus Azotimanducaceae bacterium]|jgi:predicted Zn-dependent protease